MAAAFLRLADYERAAGCCDDVVGDDAEPVDLHDAVDLGERAVQEPEVAARRWPSRFLGCETGPVSV
jgi:hypothetical protein